jgi:hypothetical protein
MAEDIDRRFARGEGRKEPSGHASMPELKPPTPPSLRRSR